MLSIPAMSISGSHEWALPPSKSHMIRWMSIVAQAQNTCSLVIKGKPGRDVDSMAYCLEKMGVDINRKDQEWLIIPPLDGLKKPSSVIDCGNSGTTARILTAIAATMGETVEIDGDESLRRRSSDLAITLRDMGVEISNDSLPVTIFGSMKGSAIVNVSNSSQPLSALIIASPGLDNDIEINLQGNAVSRGYLEMTLEIARECGLILEMDSSMRLNSWEVKPPEKVDIPPELSLFPMAILLELLHEGLNLQTELATYDPLILLALDNIDRANGNEVSLRDASDLVTPAAIWMALTNGGEITGIAHARGKESDRISRTLELLTAFGMNGKETEEGLIVPGGQSPSKPKKPIQTHQDHRLAMTAMILASKVGGEIVDAEICEVTHPGFIKQLLELSQP